MVHALSSVWRTGCGFFRGQELFAKYEADVEDQLEEYKAKVPVCSAVVAGDERQARSCRVELTASGAHSPTTKTDQTRKHSPAPC